MHCTRLLFTRLAFLMFTMMVGISSFASIRSVKPMVVTRLVRTTAISTKTLAALANPNLTRYCFRWHIKYCSQYGDCIDIVSDWSCWTVTTTHIPAFPNGKSANSENIDGDSPIKEAYVNKDAQTVTLFFQDDSHKGEEFIFDGDTYLAPQDGYPDGIPVHKVLIRKGSYQVDGNSVVIPAIIE